MTQSQLPKAYDFKSTEPRIYAMWEAGGFFKPTNDPNKPDSKNTYAKTLDALPVPERN